MTGLDDWITDLQTNLNPTKGTSSPVQVQAPTADVLAALLEIQQFIQTDGPYLPLAGGTMDNGSQIVLPNGDAVTPPLIFASPNGIYGSSNNINFTFSGTLGTFFTAGGQTTSRAGGGAVAQLNGEGSSGYLTTRYTTDTGAALVTIQKARGTIAAPAVPALNDQLGNYNFSGYNGATFTTGASIRGTLIETGAVGAAAMGTRVNGFACPIGSGTLTEVYRWETATGLSMFGANPVIDSSRVFRLRQFTVATLPANAAGQFTAVTDANATMTLGIGAVVAGGGANNVPVYNDGANWRIT